MLLTSTLFENFSWSPEHIHLSEYFSIQLGFPVGIRAHLSFSLSINNYKLFNLDMYIVHVMLHGCKLWNYETSWTFLTWPTSQHHQDRQTQRQIKRKGHEKNEKNDGKVGDINTHRDVEVMLTLVPLFLGAPWMFLLTNTKYYLRLLTTNT